MRLLLGAMAAAIALIVPAAADARTAWTTYNGDSIGSFNVAGGPVTPVNPAPLPDARRIVFSPRGDRWWMAAGAGGLLTGTVSPFTSQAVPGTAADAPEDVALSPDGSRVYVTGTTSLHVIDAATRTLIDTEGIGTAGPVAVAPDGRRVYVAAAGGSTVEIYDVAARGFLTETYAVGGGPGHLMVTPDGRKLVVSNNGDSTVSVVTLATGITETVAGLEPNPRDLALTPNGRFAHVLSGNNMPKTEVIDLAASPPAIVDTIAWTGDDGEGIAMTPNGSRALITEVSGTGVHPIDVLAGAPAAPFTVPGNPFDIAVFPNQGPRASFDAVRQAAGSATIFNARASTDPDGRVARYDWNFGDGTTLPNGGPTPAHTYARAGNYTVTLSVTDNEGASTARVFTGQQVLQNASALARTTRSLAVAAATGGRDNLAPRVGTSRPRNGRRYRRRGFKRISGTAVDRAPAGVTPSGTTRVRIGLRRQVGRRRCKALRSNGRLARTRRCSRSTPLRARGTTRWSYRLKRRLPRGKYLLRVAATDQAGNTSRKTVRFRVR